MSSSISIRFASCIFIYSFDFNFPIYFNVLCMSCVCVVPCIPPCIFLNAARNDLLGLEGRMVAMSPDDSAELANGSLDSHQKSNGGGMDHHENEKRCLIVYCPCVVAFIFLTNNNLFTPPTLLSPGPVEPRIAVCLTSQRWTTLKLSAGIVPVVVVTGE